MAHPHKKEVDASKSSKFHRMTRHYGDANPKDTSYSASTFLKGSETEAHHGLGADEEMSTPRGDKRARGGVKTVQVATYARGGKVGKHAKDGGTAHHDGMSVHPHSGKAHKHADGMHQHGAGGYASKHAGGMATGPDGGKVVARARGGRLHGKHHKGTHVNVIVAPQGGQPMPPAPPAGLAGALPPPRPPVPPMAPPMGGPPGGLPPGLMPPPGGPAGGMPPMPPRARGGKIGDGAAGTSLIGDKGKSGGMIHLHGGSISGQGRLEKMKQTKRLSKQEV